MVGRYNGSVIDVCLNGTWSSTVAQTGNMRDSGHNVLTNVYQRYAAHINSEFAIWNTNLTDGEVAQLMNAKLRYLPLQIKKANLKGYWPLDDHPQGTFINAKTFNDISGNGNHGTGVDANDNSTCIAESILSYPQDICYVDAQSGEEPPVTVVPLRMLMGVGT